MGRTAFTPDNVVNDEEGFPRLKLERNEIARIVCLEDPWSEYVHNLNAPKLLNGKPIQVKRTRMDGSEYETYEMDFIGNPLCIGDPGILLDKGLDVKNCVACAASENSDSIPKPKRRHAMHTIKYETKVVNGMVVLIEPFSVRVVMWCFTEPIFRQLVQIANEFSDTGGLPKHDLVLGPPDEPIIFQKFKIVPSDKAMWLLGGTERRDRVIETFKGNKAADDLSDPYCGKKKNKEWIEEALLKVKARWNIVNGVVGPRDMSEALDSGTLTENLDELLNMSSKPTSAPKASMEELLEAGLAAKAAESSPPEEKEEKEKLEGGLEALLADLGN